MFRRMSVALLAALLAPSLMAAELNVGAASALSNAFTELGRAFSIRPPGESVNFHFALSGILLQQQQQGSGDYDLLALNEESAMNEAEYPGLLRSSTRQPFAINHLVLIVPSHSTLPIRSLADLERRSIRRVAVENSATTPAGRVSRLALIQAGVWKSVEAKAVWAQDSHECLDLVASGSADTGFALASETMRRADEVRVVAEVTTPEPIRYFMATTQHTRQPRLAARFAEFVRSAEGQGILEHYGFTPVPPATAASLASGGREQHPRASSNGKKSK
jgi:molybdate transport system substrate-binding protein